MVMDKEPFSAASLKNVGSLFVTRTDLVSNGGGDFLDAANQGRRILHAHELYGHCYTHGICTLKDFLPALAYRSPSVQKVSSRMNASDPIFLQPYGIHLFEIQILQGTIKMRVGIQNLFIFRSHFGASYCGLNSH